LLEGCTIVALIPQHTLVASGPLASALPAAKVLAAIARGLRAGGAPKPDVCELPEHVTAEGDVRTLLDALDFDARMLAARAVVIVTRRLEEQTLADSVTFEIATRARQRGVPAYAVTGENRLDPFDARILDLQVILEAANARTLAAAGRKLQRLSQPCARSGDQS
jgi:glycerate kinase